MKNVQSGESKSREKAEEILIHQMNDGSVKHIYELRHLPDLIVDAMEEYAKERVNEVIEKAESKISIESNSNPKSNGYVYSVSILDSLKP